MNNDHHSIYIQHISAMHNNNYAGTYTFGKDSCSQETACGDVFELVDDISEMFEVATKTKTIHTTAHAIINIQPSLVLLN